MRDVGAAITKHLGVSADRNISHQEWARRGPAGVRQQKWDPGNLDMNWFRGEIAKDMRGEFEGADIEALMPPQTTDYVKETGVGFPSNGRSSAGKPCWTRSSRSVTRCAAPTTATSGDPASCRAGAERGTWISARISAGHGVVAGSNGDLAAAPRGKTIFVLLHSVRASTRCGTRRGPIRATSSRTAIPDHEPPDGGARTHRGPTSPKRHEPLQRISASRGCTLIHEEPRICETMTYRIKNYAERR